MIKTLAYGYSSESSQRELSNEYRHDRVQMHFEQLWTKVASALEGLKTGFCYYGKVTAFLNMLVVRNGRFKSHQILVTETQGIMLL